MRIGMYEMIMFMGFIIVPFFIFNVIPDFAEQPQEQVLDDATVKVTASEKLPDSGCIDECIELSWDGLGYEPDGLRDKCLERCY